MTGAHLTPEIRAREAEFAERVARLLGIERSLVHRIDVEEWSGRAPLLRVELARPITTEEALRLRYGDDAVITRTARGWTVEFPQGGGSPA